MILKFDPNTGLIPAIIQDSITQKVLMLGYMNQQAYQQTQETGKVTFYSRSQKQLWTKGETSGNFLLVKSISNDCDNDTLLIQAEPTGPVCHTGSDTCWEEENTSDLYFLSKLEDIIRDRKLNPTDASYTSSLLKKGINKIAQKVGEEAVELVIEAKDNNKKLFLHEAADLLYHYLILLSAKGFGLRDVIDILDARNKKEE
ncbi:Phosphoribosyl-AMP cyclohydrolase / Phosphoribosyl-ATP pyrophosphatase [hydrothermal vent metagenome]|uniref:Phosphoribosyl-AMP cyclohydrolase / Phosphoribosyl-ATP pyrophosphatase n=1 Tax=hydrothermal vent metagenome TaxID=652676 RepID=A0A3B0V796_9ZZZZ